MKNEDHKDSELFFKEFENVLVKIYYILKLLSIWIDQM